ncbi:MAG: hypothetical protein ACE5HS_08370 [bacterium]
MIKANCRKKFTKEDFEFIAHTLGKDHKNKAAVAKLLTDDESRDDILDHELLFDSLNQQTGFSKISPYLYFYLLTRKVFKERDLDDRNLADYVASMLAEFCSLKRAMSISRDHPKSYQYLTDMMIDFVEASSFEAFLLRSHIGNYTLLLTGIFPDYIYRKSTYGRKAPGFEYYEEMGRSSYRWAAKHKLAVKYRLVEILSNLAQQFRLVRLALNNLSDNYLTLNEHPANLDHVLRRIFYGEAGGDLSQA